VVATRAPGTTEVVVDGITGRLVPLHDPPALAKAIRDLARDPEGSRRLGEAGRVRVEAEFRASKMVERFGVLYEAIARAKGLRVD
jgi:glycosyltransferase involved in cell wall biosynthesis